MVVYFSHQLNIELGQSHWNQKRNDLKEFSLEPLGNYLSTSTNHQRHALKV